MNITMSPQQPMLSVTKAIPFQSGIFADVWRVTQERYYQVKKVCRTALINPALICLEQFGSSRQVFANTAPDATKASGVGVTLMRNGKILATGENVSLGTVNKSKVPLGLSATYGQTGNKVSAGTVQSVIGVTFIYE
ncbi:hypothetical protein EEGS03_21610 [Escherichia coli]|nr:hypothetical protein EEGS03_21610 [Escherichia coli]